MVRKGARTLAKVPPEVLEALSQGAVETVNLMEWLAADMGKLALTLAKTCGSVRLADALEKAGARMNGQGVTTRLRLAGDAIAAAVPSFRGRLFRKLACHRSDLIRQWACYAVNAVPAKRTLEERLSDTLEFASDTNMSVREAAWMAFRPHLASDLSRGLELLEPFTRHRDPNIRRFAMEVTRPRSVWGRHISELKERPDSALPLLENTRGDEARYVQLSVGNWLNDASKSRPEFVRALCARWRGHDNRHTDFIVRRALRSIGMPRGIAQAF